PPSVERREAPPARGPRLEDGVFVQSWALMDFPPVRGVRRGSADGSGGGARRPPGRGARGPQRDRGGDPRAGGGVGHEDEGGAQHRRRPHYPSRPGSASGLFDKSFNIVVGPALCPSAMVPHGNPRGPAPRPSGSGGLGGERAHSARHHAALLTQASAP